MHFQVPKISPSVYNCDLSEAASVSNQYLKQPEKCCNKNIALCGIKQQRLKKAIAVREESDHNP